MVKNVVGAYLSPCETASYHPLNCRGLLHSFLECFITHCREATVHFIFVPERCSWSKSMHSLFAHTGKWGH